MSRIAHILVLIIDGLASVASRIAAAIARALGRRPRGAAGEAPVHWLEDVSAMRPDGPPRHWLEDIRARAPALADEIGRRHGIRPPGPLARWIDRRRRTRSRAAAPPASPDAPGVARRAPAPAPAEPAAPDRVTGPRFVEAAARTIPARERGAAPREAVARDATAARPRVRFVPAPRPAEAARPERMAAAIEATRPARPAPAPAPATASNEGDATHASPARPFADAFAAVATVSSRHGAEAAALPVARSGPQPATIVAPPVAQRRPRPRAEPEAVAAALELGVRSPDGDCEDPWPSLPEARPDDDATAALRRLMTRRDVDAAVALEQESLPWNG